jgi:hypothetical protein
MARAIVVIVALDAARLDSAVFWRPVDRANWRLTVATAAIARATCDAGALDTNARVTIIELGAHTALDALRFSHRRDGSAGVRTRVVWTRERAMGCIPGAPHVLGWVTNPTGMVDTKEAGVRARRLGSALGAIGQRGIDRRDAHQIIAARILRVQGVAGAETLLFNAQPLAFLAAVCSLLTRNAAVVFFICCNLAVGSLTTAVRIGLTGNALLGR